MQSVFKETQIPLQQTETKDKATVAIIFERVNRQGVELDTLQLLSAWTWSEEFQLQEQFEELSEELRPFGFSGLGEDTNLLLRCCSAVLMGDAAPDALMDMNGANVRANFEQILNGVRYAVDYLRNNFGTEKLANLPFSTQLVPLVAFFATPGTKEFVADAEQSRAINRWFWRSSFSRRYSSGVLRTLKADIGAMKALRAKESDSIGSIAADIDPSFFIHNRFGINNVNTKAFILLLATNSPRSFISGDPINIGEKLNEANRNEFHHMMPRSFLEQSEQKVYHESILANFCFMSRAENRALGGVSPSRYRRKMPADVETIMRGAFTSEGDLFSDNYPYFVHSRAGILTEAARSLCEL